MIENDFVRDQRFHTDEADDYRTTIGVARNIEVIKHALVTIAVLMVVIMWLLFSAQ